MLNSLKIYKKSASIEALFLCLKPNNKNHKLLIFNKLSLTKDHNS